MPSKDYYQILGVPRNADTNEIKKAYRELALKYHPDRNQDSPDAEEKFKEASEAYSVLGNPEKRQIYDQYGIDGLKSSNRGFSDFSFFSDSIFSDFEDILGSFFGFDSPFSGGRRQHSRQKGRDMGMEVQLTLEEAYKGVEKSVEIEKETNCIHCDGSGSEPGKDPEVCQQCGGSGNIRRTQGFFSISTPCQICRGSGKVVTHPCQECQGKGRTLSKKEIKVAFPPGIDTGHKLRVSGEGEDGFNGGRPGDLYLIINLQDDRNFKRQENDLIYELEIAFSQAALGDEVKIKTYSGTEKIKIPPETQNNKVIRIKGKGFKNVNGWGKGDFLVVIKVSTPKKLSAAEKRIFKELREIELKKKQTAGKDNKDLFVQ